MLWAGLLAGADDGTVRGVFLMWVAIVIVGFFVICYWIAGKRR